MKYGQGLVGQDLVSNQQRSQNTVIVTLHLSPLWLKIFDFWQNINLLSECELDIYA